MTVRTAIHRSVPASALPDFTPVPRKVQRHDGWTPARQRAFIEALADTGCVAIACRMVNMSQPSYYQLRRQPGAESFRAAADAAQTLGLQVVKDEAFDRAMNGEVIPVFVAGKLMGFRRKKNDGLLMFILRHYGQDAQGRKTTINYFSTRATAGAAKPPSPLRGEGRGEGESGALAAAEASTTTVKTVITGRHQSTTLRGGISGPGDAPTQLAADDNAANILNAFEGVELDAEAQDQIHRALAACAERRRALADDPENDPERYFVGPDEAGAYLGELESGVEGDWVEYRPEGEHRWESLGEGGQAAEIDKVVAEIEARRAARTPEEIAAEKAEDEAELARMREQRALPTPVEPDPSLPRTGSDDPRLDWHNWGDGGYTPPENPPRNGEGDQPEPWAEAGGGVEPPAGKPRRAHKPRKAYKKRTPKPPFTAPDEANYETRKAKAVKQVEAERSEAAAAEAKRREARARRD